MSRIISGHVGTLPLTGVGGPTQQICNPSLEAESVSDTLISRGGRLIRSRPDDAQE